MSGPLLALAALLAAPPAPDVSPYTGAFRGVQLGAGPIVADEAGVGFSLGVRASSVIHLADLELEYRFASPSMADVTQHQAVLAAQFHPLFLFLLTNNRWGATLASLFVRVGVGPTLTTAGGSRAFGVAWDWGVGLDVPLTSPDEGSSFWIGALYDRSSAIGEDAFEQGTVQFVLLRIGFRLNGL